MAEMARLGVCMGAKEYTFSGLTGIGDLIVTCMSEHSRNNRFGRLLGEGVSLQEALERIGTVEGYYAAEMAHGLALKFGIELPIISECYAVMYEGKGVKEALISLMERPGRSEH
jgi:glycerol-3-phosphate dehydrogenase (NAD(P)+)